VLGRVEHRRATVISVRERSTNGIGTIAQFHHGNTRTEV
jgi:hypothetical protein